MCSMLIFLSACSGGGANASDQVSSGSPNSNPNTEQVAEGTDKYLSEDSLSWDEILEAVGSESAKDALVNNYEETKEYIVDWLKDTEKGNFTSVRYHNPEFYFPNDNGADCIFEMEIDFDSTDERSLRYTENGNRRINVRIYEDKPETLICKFTDRTTSTKKKLNLDENVDYITGYHEFNYFPTYDQAGQFLEDDVENCLNTECTVENPLEEVEKMDFNDIMHIVDDSLKEDRLYSAEDEWYTNEHVGAVANYIENYLKDSGFDEVSTDITEFEGPKMEDNATTEHRYVITAAITNMPRIKGILQYELVTGVGGPSGRRESFGYYDRYSGQNVMLFNYSGIGEMRTLSEVTDIVKYQYEQHLENEDKNGTLKEFD